MGAIPAQLAPYAFKPGQHTVGRVAGNPNKLTSYVRNVLAGAFHKIGGEEAFVQWAQNNPTDFYCRLWIKLLPDSSQLSEEEREKVLDAMLGVQKVLTQEYKGEQNVTSESGALDASNPPGGQACGGVQAGEAGVPSAPAERDAGLQGGPAVDAERREGQERLPS